MLLAFLALSSFATAKRIRDRIYLDLVADKYCFRRFNGTHQFGCTSDLDGNVGVVHLIENAGDVDWIVKKGPHAPYIAAFRPNTFSRANLARLADSGKLSGAVLLSPDSVGLTEPGYSDDRSCPNRDSSLYAGEPDDCNPDNLPWNPWGEDDGLAFGDFNFPVLIVRDKDTATQITKDCYDEFNRPTGPDLAPREWPLCALELKSHMYAATDTETCLRRGGHTNLLTSIKYCDRMGDRNAFLFMRERNMTEDEDEDAVTVVAARLDALTMFDGTEKGADSPTTGIVTLLETARLLSKQPPDFSGSTQNILFAFFHGESFDYIGSSRFFYDVKEGLFPDKPDSSKFSNGQQPLLKLDSIDLFLEVGQVFNGESGGNLYLHADEDSVDRQGVLDQLVRTGRGRVRRASGDKLPPSSAQTYLKEAGRQEMAVLLADYDQQYSNR